MESGLEWASDAVLARAVAETTGESDDEDIDGEALPDEGEDEEEEDESPVARMKGRRIFNKAGKEVDVTESEVRYPL